MSAIRIRLAAGAALLALAGATSALAAAPLDARAAHEAMTVFDTHFDTPANAAMPGWSILDRHEVRVDGSQIDYPRMVEGGVDGGFWAVYTGQQPRTAAGIIAARDAALVRASVIREMVAGAPAQFQLAVTPADAAAITVAGKRVVYMSMENSQAVAGDLSLMGTFYKLGVRLMGPVHFLNNELADSSTDPAGAEWNGLSPLGRQFVTEANRLGILLDASHASDLVLDQMIAQSKTPILLSHTGVKAIYDHPRNIDDNRLRALARSGGVISLNAYSAYMIASPRIPERQAAVEAVNAKYGPANARNDAARATARTEMDAIEARWPTPRATFDDFMKHLDHAIAVAGIEHVGISGDFDGGGGVTGFDSALDYPKITAHLLSKGHSPADINKMWSGNVLRILGQAQAGRTAD